MKNDKDVIILKYEQENVLDAERELSQLRETSANQDERLRQMQERLSMHGGGKTKRAQIQISKRHHVRAADTATADMSYDQLYAIAEASLIERGLDADEFEYHGLVSESELDEIIKDLNSALPREEKWSKPDYVVTFIAAFLGCAADIILSNRDNKYTGKDSKFSEWLNELHEKTFKHKGGAPIDYQGTGFGGGHHRELSKGHDLARFIEGIKMFKEGKFEGIRFVDNTPIKVISSANQFGKPYTQLTTIEAIINYAGHMFADLFSTYSLPFPGYSFFRESSSREMRKLAYDMYKSGFNLKNVMTQSLSAIIIEIIIRLYYSIQSVRQYSKKVEIDEEYSNAEAFKNFINPEHKEKLNEMLLVAHAIVMAENSGKIAFKCIVAKDLTSLSQVNIAEIVAVVRYGVIVVKNIAARNNEYAKLIYHKDGVNEKWAELDKSFEDDAVAALEECEILIL